MSEGMTGTISKLDREKKIIELQGDRKLHVDPTTEIRRGGKSASFSDLHEGDDVRASFQGDDRSNVKKIEVISGNPSSSGSSSDRSSSSGRQGK